MSTRSITAPTSTLAASWLTAISGLFSSYLGALALSQAALATNSPVLFLNLELSSSFCFFIGGCFATIGLTSLAAASGLHRNLAWGWPTGIVINLVASVNYLIWTVMSHGEELMFSIALIAALWSILFILNRSTIKHLLDV